VSFHELVYVKVSWREEDFDPLSSAPSDCAKEFRSWLEIHEITAVLSTSETDCWGGLSGFYKPADATTIKNWLSRHEATIKEEG